MTVQQRNEPGTIQRKAARRPANNEPVYTIGDLSKEFSVSLRTLRFYEDRGLLSPLRQGLSRLYTQEDKSRIKTILRGKELGFSLAEIKEMIFQNISRAIKSRTSDSLELSPEKIANQIAHLERNRERIDAAIKILNDELKGIS